MKEQLVIPHRVYEALISPKVKVIIESIIIT